MQADSLIDAIVSPPGRRRNRVRFSLASLLLLTVPLGLSFVGIRAYLENFPISWQEFSKGQLFCYLDAGRTVLVDFRTDWSDTPTAYQHLALEAPSVRRAIRLRHVVPLRCEATVNDEIHFEDNDGIDVCSPPAVVICHRDRTPIVLRGMITEAQILNAIELASRTGN